MVSYFTGSINFSRAVFTVTLCVAYSLAARHFEITLTHTVLTLETRQYTRRGWLSRTRIVDKIVIWLVK